MDDENPQSFVQKFLRGRKLTEIPCFRNSFLYGISSGLAGGLIYFMFTSKPLMTSHVSMAVFSVTTLSYWFYCRYKLEADVRSIQLLADYMRNRVEKEGTQDDIVHEVSYVEDPKNIKS